MSPSKVLLSLGSNIGDKKNFLQSAIDLISLSLVKIDKISSIYRSEPVGYKDQDWFYNLCLIGKTTYAPEELIKNLKEIENQKRNRYRYCFLWKLCYIK
jgi:2-amino-4-hydroxy-6-hydroxymethyldihydropteridine diphosphokinase